jgi:hypothetical protein
VIDETEADIDERLVCFYSLFPVHRLVLFPVTSTTGRCNHSEPDRSASRLNHAAHDRGCDDRKVFCISHGTLIRRMEI